MREETIQYLDRVCGGLQKAANMVREDGQEVLALNNHIELIWHYYHLRSVTERIKEAREALDKLENALSHEQIPTIMKEVGVKTVNIEKLGRVTVSYRWGCSMLDKDEGMNWLRDNGQESLIIETVNSSTLAAFARNMLEEEGQSLPDDIFKTSLYPFTSITKVR